MLLGGAYEQQENKFNAINNYKEALRINPNCYSAFEKLIKNNLLVDQDKIELIESINFTNESIWLKDFYLSKINKDLAATLDRA